MLGLLAGQLRIPVDRHQALLGAKVALGARTVGDLERVAADIAAAGGQALVAPCDVLDPVQVEGMVKRVVDTWGRLDILVNNAATNPHFGSVLDAEDSLWQKTIEVNIMGNVWLTQAVVPHMQARGGGKIVNIASVNGLRPGTMQGIYSLTKAAVISLTQTLAMELAADNIHVNAIAPGLTRTKFARALWDNPMILDPIVARTPLKRIGEPEDIAGIALYLASPASNYTTGQVFVVDGGLTIPML